ncbi:MAG TPA: YbaB/EbfC family nucleoid-associated protein [Ruminiclostridium sp.]|nr:YbaB/EbfC family nucleoid-associated protein [Ruminiclostridium sp.]
MKARLPQGYGGGASNMNSMIKQAQKMQEEMGKVQQELEEKVYDVTSGGGAVKVTITGKREIKDIELKPEVVDPDDIEMLQDMIVAAVNEAIRKVNDVSEEEMSKVTSGLNMPGLF